MKIPIITIQGTTAVGKSDFALQLAQEFETQIISADSRQVYKYLDIGTAKPTIQDRKKVQHHLIDIVTPDDQYTAGDFSREADKIISELHKTGKIPIIVGGTWFYIKALLQGLAKVPSIPENVRENLWQLYKKKGKKYLYNKLQQVDTKAAEKINQNDLQKMLRALEVWEYTRQPLSSYWQQQKGKQRYLPINILLYMNRSELYGKINTRIDRMIEAGLLQEIKQLLKNYSEDAPGMITVGYREFFPYFSGKSSLLECVQLAKQHTRNFAKRQITWYRKQEFDLTLNANDINLLQVTKELKKIAKGLWL
ncbi:MAG: tRNA (adenosine(37)-N6)-dimethylallyltransferase MiaA [Candidatus Cloacimonadota bacterium]|nr:tRNA (adenosine(37)-N6)-dimethylallyltransferase MiaA [Candidatus Cloacimonadota bacterium]